MPARPRRRDRWIALGLIVIGLALVAVRLSLVQGLLTTVRITGGSMGESLPGEHTDFVCANCGQTTQSDAASTLAAENWCCPNCATWTSTNSSASTTSIGSRVLIDRGSFVFREPSRWEIVAFTSPTDAAEPVVKRVVALPGETWSIRSGDLYIGEDIVAKSYEVFRRMSIPVHDDRFRPQNGKPRWRGGEWEAISAGYTKTSISSNSSREWLEYHHTALHPAAANEPAPVKDFDAYNPSITRPLHDVFDLIAECDCERTADSTFLLRVHDGYEEIVIELTGEQALARRAKKEIAKAKYGFRPQQQIAWGILDRCLLLIVDGMPILEQTLPGDKKMRNAIAMPLAINVLGSAALKNLRITRDVHYLDPNGVTDTWLPEQPLGAAEFALLGDNPPLSIDSRAWNGINQSAVLGKVSKRLE